MAIFDRDATGALTQKPGPAGCITEGGAGSCQAGQAFAGGLSLAISPDGKDLYVASINSSGIAAFARNTDG